MAEQPGKAKIDDKVADYLKKMTVNDGLQPGGTKKESSSVPPANISPDVLAKASSPVPSTTDSPTSRAKTSCSAPAAEASSRLCRPSTRAQRTPLSLHDAAAQGDVRAVRNHLALGCRVDARDSCGATALLYAARWGRPEVVAFLLQAGATVNATENQQGRAPLHWAALQGILEGPKQDIPASTARTLPDDYLKAASLLLASGADSKKQDQQGRIPLHHAAVVGWEPMVKFLLQKTKFVDNLDKQNNSALMLALKSGHMEVARLLVRRGANPELENQDLEVTFVVAAQSGNAEVLEEMLKCAFERKMGKARKLPFDRQKTLNLCVIEEALAVAGSAAVVEVIAEWFPMLMIGPAGSNALYEAAGDGRTEVVAALLTAGVGPDSCDSQRWTALMIAASLGETSVTQTLLDAGADLNVRTSLYLEDRSDAGLTALHLAALEGHKDCVQLLLRWGADKNIKNLEGRTALQLAVERDQYQCARLLQQDK